MVPVDPDRPNLRHQELKQFVLDLINDRRIASGKDAVALGKNVAAQLHAESMLNNCFSSHWGLDGLKPHMRYSLAGSYQLSRESISGQSFCHTAGGPLAPYGDLKAKVEHSLGNWIDGRERWANIVRGSHRTVDIGLAWNEYQVFTVLHFEEDYIERLDEATIDGEYLTLAARVHNGVVFENPRHLLIEIVYDPPVHALTRGQLSRTYCYDSERRIAAIRPTPLGGPGHYAEAYTVRYESCLSPYEVSPDSPPPQSAREARTFREEAAELEPVILAVPYINANEWLVAKESFSIRAHVDVLLATYGPGVYTVLIYGPVGGESTLLLEYPIFYRIDSPATYDRW